MTLQVEVNKDFVQRNTHVKIGENAVLSSVLPDENYWLFRVKLHADQSIVAFPKHGMIGIGFAEEEDWNTNLPSTIDAQEIFDHIKHNKKYSEIPDDDCIKAIQMIQATIQSLEE